MKIYVRSDLKMRKGKMAAQSAHASNKILLDYSTFDEKTQKITIQKNVHDKVLDVINNNNIQINFVENESEINSLINKRTALIVDHGRTEFHGIKTVTVLSSDLIDLDIKNEHSHEHENDIFSKQLIVFSKENPLSKENACKLAAISSLSILINLFKKNLDDSYSLDLEADQAVKYWLNGAFAKISVATKTNEELLNLSEKLNQSGIHNEIIQIDDNYVLCVSPQFPENIDPFTKDLKLI